MREDWLNRLKTDPIRPERSVRPANIRMGTSCNAGKIVPLHVEPLLREDGYTGRLRFDFEMAETAENIQNGVIVNAHAYFVPFLAFERFNGFDQFNRSFMKTPETDGGSVVPFIQTAVWPAHGTSEILKTLGLHYRPGNLYNTAYVEAYNTLVNFRRKQRSPRLTQRAPLNHTLAEAFWDHTAFKHIVPDFDQAMLDGNVPLNVVNSKLSVLSNTSLRGSNRDINVQAGPGPGKVRVHQTVVQAADELFVELNDMGITVSLANIKAVEKTAAFARLRTEYAGYDDDYIIDLLMNAVRVPEQSLRFPILLDHKRAVFGMSTRYATEADALDQSVTVGRCSVDMTLRLPPVNTGGVIMITAEITPEQMFERQRDIFLTTTDQDKWPQYLRDYLDPEKVDVVPNEQVDVDHSDPQGTFGYAPLNYAWMRDFVRLGGKFYRPEVDASFDEDRQRFWAVETEDPVLTEDFWLCTNMHQKVFADTEADAFEVFGRGMASITGNTVFGAGLIEANGEFEEIAAKVDYDRIEKDD